LTADQDFFAFVRQHVRSVWALELLLLLRRDPQRSWRAPDLVRELRASQNLVSDNLEHFERTGLVVRDADASARYAPASSVLDEMCAQLETAYRERPVTMVNMIARPDPTLQSLADAFRIRGKDR
jgi:DNA-binding HxlR family transcriptional regulator